MESKKPRIFMQGFLNNGASTRDCNARRSRRGTLACACVFSTAEIKKALAFLQGLKLWCLDPGSNQGHADFQSKIENQSKILIYLNFKS